MSFGLFLHLAVLAFLASCASSVRLHGRNLNAELLPSYDYIVVGGGISGLVIGNRLSEDPKVMVLVIEAGIADHYEEFIQVPQFVGSDVGSQYDWNLSTVPQSFLDGAPRPYPQGKALGGGSILNAMCWNRGGQDTFDAWEDFGNPGWGWDGLLPYFKKSETYTPVDSPEIAAQFSISYNPDVHGTEGPVQVSYPKYFYNQSANFFAALNQLGLAVDLPGVGNNLQDHYLVGTFYPYNNVSASPAELTQNATFDRPWTAGSPNGLAFPSLPSTSNISTSILQAADDQEPDEYLVTGLDSSVVAGYAAQKNSLVRSLLDTNVAAWEIINNNIGSLTVAVMHPFSRGTCYIDSPNPFVPPLIDPRYGSNPVDLRILVEALKFNRRILATDAMVELQPAQFVPPADADEDELMEVVKNGIRTEYHPSGTCAMLPKDQGGVVDSHLRVYGTQNLRVVDASIFPLVPAAHLQAVVYGVAEKMTSSLPRSATRAALSSAETGLSLIQPTPSGSVTASSGGPTSAAPTGLDAAQQKQQQDAIATFIAWLRQLLASFTS
ncbi:MAG: hypothetical protein M1832_005495 [Thelocarpon impressellum]|nr:MAG: hypothetical protein M1832_005495 [Thelocarpon impressellum]